MLNVLALAGENDEKIQTINYNVGDLVKILTGPFATMEGKIAAINKEKLSATVEIIFFGRATEAEIELNNMSPIK